MSQQEPPAWDNDPLSKFFAEAEFNDRVTALNFGRVYEVLQYTHELLLRVNAVTEEVSREELLVPRILMARVHSSFLAALRLAMSGQVLESFPVLRAAVEQTWYAVHIAKDPERARIWLNRNEGTTEKSRAKSEFTVKNVKDTHTGLDAVTARTLHEIYEMLIDFGAHPNQFGVMSSMSTSETDEQINLTVGVLHPAPPLILFGLRTACNVAIGALKAFQLIFPAQFSSAGIDEEIEKLIGGSNGVFEAYGPKTKK